MSDGNGDWELTCTPGPGADLMPNGELVFREIKAPLFEIEQQGWFDTSWLFHPYHELVGYEMPITKILEDNSMRGQNYAHGLEVTITKAKLLKILKENRTKHKKVYDEAVKGYAASCEARLREEIARLKKRSKPAAISISMPAPVDHTKDYDRLITMFQLASETKFELNEQQVANFIMDEWDWTDRFLMSNAPYSETATLMMQARE